MTINSIGSTGNSSYIGTSGINTETDSFIREIQNQITKTQQELQELSSNKELSAEEKMKKRQQLQKQITDLNNQLRQYQIEQRKQKQQQSTSVDDMLGDSQKTAQSESQQNGLSEENMYAMISADFSMQQAKEQGSLTSKMEGQANILKSEIQADKGRGRSSEAKEGELADIQARIETTTASQLSTLTKATKLMQETANSENVSGTDDNINTSETEAEEISLENNQNSLQSILYTHIDVLL